MKNQIWHNPENVPASKVPKGWRFRRVEEVSVSNPASGGCRMWESENNGWSKDNWTGISPFRTYIVPRKATKTAKRPKVKPFKKQETLWAIRDPKGILHSTIRKTAKTAWGDFLAGTGASQKDMKNAGYRAVKVTVSYEVKE